MNRPRSHWTLSELAAALPVSRTTLKRRAKREGWPSRTRKASPGATREYARAALPADLRSALESEPAAAPAGPSPARPAAALTAAQRERGAERAALLLAAETRAAPDGLSPSAAVIAEAAERGIGESTALRWLALTRGLPAAEWAPALADRRGGASRRTEIPPDAWDFFISLYLSRARPTLAETHRRACEAAEAAGWGPLPDRRAFARRVESDVSEQARLAAREGLRAAALAHPPQRRDKSAYAPGQAVVGDGLKFDRLRVLWPDGEIVATATSWLWADLRTCKLLAWRTAKTESMDLFRLATYDLAGVCSPRLAWLDNTRVAASKSMTGRSPFRHRGKARPEDPPGLLVEMGVEPRFTHPDRVTGSPGAKPIERSFGIGGLHQAVATHPALAGRGFSAETAVPLAEFEAVLAHEVERFNARPKRRTAECRGLLSFDQAWEELLPEGGGAFGPLPEQRRRLLLLVPEAVKADKRSGEIRLSAGRGPLGRHRYWSEELGECKGRALVAKYDPRDLNSAVDVYDPDGRFVCRARHLDDAGFGDTEAAREWAKQKRRHAKAAKRAAEAERRLGALELQAAYPSGGERPAAPLPEAPGARAAAALPGGPSEASARLDDWLLGELDWDPDLPAERVS